MRLGNRIYRPGDRAEGFRGGSDAVGKTASTGLGIETIIFSKIDTYGAVKKPRLPDPGGRRG